MPFCVGLLVGGRDGRGVANSVVSVGSNVGHIVGKAVNIVVGVGEDVSIVVGVGEAVIVVNGTIASSVVTWPLTNVQ